VCLVLVLANVGVNGIYKFATDQGNYSSEFPKSGYEVDRFENALEREAERYLLNDPAGRADGSSFKMNTSMVWRIPGSLYYTTVANKNVIEFEDKIENRGNWNAFLKASSDQRTIVNTLLSTKYHVEPEKNTGYVPYGYELIQKTKSGNLVYENNYALPWGYTYDTVISYKNLDEINGIEKQEAMLQAIALEDIPNNTEIATIQFDEYSLPYEMKFNNCKWEDGNLVVANANATITLNFSMPAGVEGYVRLTGLDTNGLGSTVFWLKVNHEDISKQTYVASDLYTYYYGRENYLFNLGYRAEERTSLTITFPSKGTFKLKNIQLYALPMNNYSKHVEALRAEPLENIEWGVDRLTGTLDISKDKVLCVSVPYSKGWSAFVDGKKVEILRGNYMFMAIPLKSGHHEIELRYCSPGIKLGALVSLGSIFLLVVLILNNCKSVKKAKISQLMA